mgnify:CR=1 FL=1
MGNAGERLRPISRVERPVVVTQRLNLIIRAWYGEAIVHNQRYGDIRGRCNSSRHTPNRPTRARSHHRWHIRRHYGRFHKTETKTGCDEEHMTPKP